LAIGHLSLFIVHCSLFIVLSACARPDVTWERVRESGILRVGMDASFPPFETIAVDGTLVGFDVDLARELGRRLGPVLSEPVLSEAEGAEGAEGVKVQFVANLPYDGLYDALAVGRVDVVMSALVVNPARMADFAYSTPYFDAGQVLVAREKPDRFRKTCQVSDMDGCTLAVEFGTHGDLEARKWARRLSDLTVVPYQTAAELGAGGDGQNPWGFGKPQGFRGFRVGYRGRAGRRGALRRGRAARQPAPAAGNQ
jgi:ABC-type amino acid transport substrate-binding protein